MRTTDYTAVDETLQAQLDSLQKRLAAAEDKNRELSSTFDAIGRGMGIVEFDPDGNLLAMNDEFARMTGYSAEELVGAHHSRLCDSDYASSDEYREFWRALSSGEPHQGLFPRVGKSGECFWIRAFYNPVLSDDGRIRKYVELAADGTEERETRVMFKRMSEGLNVTSTNIMINDADRRIVYANPAVMEMFRKRRQQLRQRFPGFDPDNIVGQSMDDFHKNPAHQAHMLRDRSRMPHTSEMEVVEIDFRVHASYIADDNGDYMGNIVEWEDITQGLAAEREIRALVAGASRGEFDARLAASNYDGFFRSIAELLNELVETTSHGLNDIAGVMKLVSAGDLSGRIETEYEGLFAQLKNDVNNTIDSLNAGCGDVMRVLHSLAGCDLSSSIDADHPGIFAQLKVDANTTTERLRSMVAQIRDASSSINTSSSEIARGNLDLSQRTEEQASSLEETAASMEQITSAVMSAADNANRAREVAEETSRQAGRGGEIVGRAISAMEGITDASNQIAGIIGIIDDIAFQTNLLALNAAVEAARAGEQGRGFAVVAAEVRGLAQRSAEAAKEIKSLIKNTTSRVEDGSKLVNSSGSILGEIVENISKVSTLVGDIATAAKEQAQGIEQVNNAVTQLDEVTQWNAALVEEAAAASKSMDDQTHILEDLVTQFRL